MKALKSRLYDLEMKKRTQAIQDAHDAKGDIGWGNQIRSYVLQPYQMVKDLRTGVETSDTQGVLDGKLDEFMGAALAQEVTGQVAGGSGQRRLKRSALTLKRQNPAEAYGFLGLLAIRWLKSKAESYKPSRQVLTALRRASS